MTKKFVKYWREVKYKKDGIGEAYQDNSSLNITLNIESHEINNRLLSRIDVKGDEASIPSLSDQLDQWDNLDDFIMVDDDNEMKSSSTYEEELILEDDSDWL